MQIKDETNLQYLLLRDNPDKKGGYGELNRYVNDYADSQKWVSRYYILFLFVSLVILIVAILEVFHLQDKLFEHLWRIIIFYSAFMIVSLIMGILLVSKSINNGLLSKIQQRMIKKILNGGYCIETRNNTEYKINTVQDQHDISIQVERTDAGFAVNISFDNSFLK